MNTKIQKFTDLNVWSEGHKLVLMIYEGTERFPRKETFSLVDQMRRASVSITSNIAEGFTRSGKKDKIRFYVMSAGSVTELQNQLIIAKDLGYINKNEYTNMYKQTIIVHKMTNGLIRSIKC